MPPKQYHECCECCGEHENLTRDVEDGPSAPWLCKFCRADHPEEMFVGRSCYYRELVTIHATRGNGPLA